MLAGKAVHHQSAPCPPAPACSYTYPIYYGVLRRTLRSMRGVAESSDGDADSIKPGSSEGDLAQLA